MLSNTVSLYYLYFHFLDEVTEVQTGDETAQGHTTGVELVVELLTTDHDQNHHPLPKTLGD